MGRASMGVDDGRYIGEALALRSSQKGRMVLRFEEAFARYVGAKHAISHCNGTSTMHTALAALGVARGDQVAVPPLTYASTTLAVLHAGAVPKFVDVDKDTWLCEHRANWWEPGPKPSVVSAIPVSLYGLWSGHNGKGCIDDAAETLNPHQGASFTSYSFEASKIIPIGEGGMLVTDDDELAWKARQFRCVGYHRGGPEDENVFAPSRSPSAIRHDVIGWNYLMSDVQAAVGLARLECAAEYIEGRRYSAACYREAIAGCEWITAQAIPDGWPMTWWVFGIALDRAERWEPLARAVQDLGGEVPRGAFRLTYQEPAFRHLASAVLVPHRYPDDRGPLQPFNVCPVAEDLQPRLMQLATNHNKNEAEKAAETLHKAIALF